MNQFLSAPAFKAFPVTILPEKEQAKNDALAITQTITAVSSGDEQADALAAAGLCKELINGVDESYEVENRPVIDAGRFLRTIRDGFKDKLVTEKERLELLASRYQAAQDAAAAEARAQAEQAQREQRDAEQAEQGLEAAALREIRDRHEAGRRDDLLWIDKATSDSQRESAQIVADYNAEIRAEEVSNIQLACREAEDARLEAERSRVTQLATITPSRPTAATVRRQLDYTVTDMHALYLARPDLVELTVRRAAVLTAISVPGVDIPGLRVFQSTKVASRI